MTKFDLLKEVMKLIEDYEQSDNAIMDIESFVLWLNAQVLGIQPIITFNPESTNNTDLAEWRIAYFIGLMNKYAKIHVKKALKGSPLLNLDDFGFLITLCYEGSKTKTELIQSNVSEVSSGMEIIKRMERKGLIVADKDEADKRAIRIAATAKGQQVLGKMMPLMYQATNVIAGNLTLEERLHLLILLNKLHIFHNEIYLNDAKSDLGEIQGKYL